LAVYLTEFPFMYSLQFVFETFNILPDQNQTNVTLQLI